MTLNFQESDATSVVAALLELSGALLDELLIERGAGAWMHDMHRRVADTVGMQNVHGLTDGQQERGIDAGLAAVDAVFQSRR